MSTYDIGLFHDLQYLAAFGDKGEAVTGPAKVAQKFSSAFLTEAGSVPYKPTYGTEFVTQLNAGSIRTDLDVTVYFIQAAADAVYYLNAQLTGDEPSNEVIQSVVLDHFELVQPDLKLYVTLLTQDGTSQTLILPVQSIGV